MTTKQTSNQQIITNHDENEKESSFKRKIRAKYLYIPKEKIRRWKKSDFGQ